jgi:integrase/recombinase XerD
MVQPSLFDTAHLKPTLEHQAKVVPPSPDSTVLETLPAYHLYLKSGDYSSYTADDFARSDMKKLGLFIPAKRVAQITTVDLQRWITFLASPTGEQLQAKTVSRKIAALRNYFQWLHRLKMIPVDPTLNIKTTRITSPLPDVLYEEECQRLLRTASADPRAYLLVLLLLETGLKKAELFTLKVAHFDFSDRYNPILWIKHEGKKAVKNRKLRLPATIVPVFEDYRKRYMIQEQLFPYTPRTIETILKDAGAQAGITKPVTAQILRDTCAVRLLEHGKSMDDVLKKLGLNPSTWDDAKDKYLRLTAPAL